MLETLRMNRTDNALPNAADDTPRDNNILRHVGEEWWAEERRISRLILSVWKFGFLLILYGKLSKTWENVYATGAPTPSLAEHPDSEVDGRRG